MNKEELINRILDTPAGKEILSMVEQYDNEEFGPWELVARIYLALEDQYNWGVDCVSCASLLNKLYAAEMKIEELEENPPVVVEGNQKYSEAWDKQGF